jgi:hypothetical protein
MPLVIGGNREQRQQKPALGKRQRKSQKQNVIVMSFTAEAMARQYEVPHVVHRVRREPGVFRHSAGPGSGQR